MPSFPTNQSQKKLSLISAHKDKTFWIGHWVYLTQEVFEVLGGPALVAVVFGHGLRLAGFRAEPNLGAVKAGSLVEFAKFETHVAVFVHKSNEKFSHFELKTSKVKAGLAYLVFSLATAGFSTMSISPALMSLWATPKRPRSSSNLISTEELRAGKRGFGSGGRRRRRGQSSPLSSSPLEEHTSSQRSPPSLASSKFKSDNSLRRDWFSLQRTLGLNKA